MSDTIKCPTCQASVPVPNLDVAVISLSLMYVTHEQGVECPKCLAYLKPAIVNLPNGIFGWVPVEKPVDAPRVISPLSLVN